MQSILRRAPRLVVTAARAQRSAVPARMQFVRTIVTTRYTKEHEAVIFDDETGHGMVTITDYAQSSLGDVVFVELPEIGSEISQGGEHPPVRSHVFIIAQPLSLDQIGAVESVKAASDIYAPVSGTVEDINQNLADQPGLLNKSPEQDGWLCKIKLSKPEELETLMTKEAYDKEISAES
ncbi:glycine cleavage system H protein [Fistulina hepatica ATCC 64428]|uniref:Glycine cleavage system H protein n=1 Tax=Fistulina hepatica ATCC 64428 TaxID=1128425 RepID=A0A0D7A7M6_9AGAR|nr:glycine cleavage system H protein [Fistulina hepatica ATCC 64428]